MEHTPIQEFFDNHPVLNRAKFAVHCGMKPSYFYAILDGRNKGTSTERTTICTMLREYTPVKVYPEDLWPEIRKVEVANDEG